MPSGPNSLPAAPANQGRNLSSGPLPARDVMRVFVSSTFQDMQAEREELMKRVFPRLPGSLRGPGVTWGEVDGAVGITTPRPAGKALPICLAEIDGCRPFFLGLLGDRYGWRPEALEAALDRAPPDGSRTCSDGASPRWSSATASLNDPAARPFFDLRDPSWLDTLPLGARPGPLRIGRLESRAKLTALKNEVRAILPRSGAGLYQPPHLGRLVEDERAG